MIKKFLQRVAMLSKRRRLMISAQIEERSQAEQCESVRELLRLQVARIAATAGLKHLEARALIVVSLRQFDANPQASLLDLCQSARATASMLVAGRQPRATHTNVNIIKFPRHHRQRINGDQPTPPEAA